MNKTLISVLNYNNFQATKNCVYSILKYSIENSEVFIVDNNSSDESVKFLIKEFPSLKIIKSKSNNGYASGHKISADYAIKNSFDYLWILNNDLTVRENSLSSLLNAANKYGLGLYGSVTLKSENPDVINFGGGLDDDIKNRFNYNAFEGVLLKNYDLSKKIKRVQCIEGSSFLVPIKLIKKYGFMRSDFFMYVEEVDYCFMLKKYFNIPSYIVKSSIVVHKGGVSLKNQKHLEKYYRRRNQLIFLNQYYGQKILSLITKKNSIFTMIYILIKGVFFKSEKRHLILFKSCKSPCSYWKIR